MVYGWPGKLELLRRAYGVLHLMGGGPVGPGVRPMGHITAAVYQPYFWINQHVKRFCDENIAHNISFVGRATSKQKGGYCFAIFDENLKQYFLKKGIDVGFKKFIPVTARLTNLEAEIKTALEKGNTNVFVADTLDELAGKMAVDPTVFKKTVEEYNKFCEKGHDDQFAKDPKYLVPIKAPKFYAIKSYTAFIGTLGGIKINEKTEVLDKNDDVIPGLYAVGADAGGMYGDSYDLFSSGGSLGFAVNSGRIAGDNALKYVGK
jgi:fumarate reductase flavoprotein subunit